MQSPTVPMRSSDTRILSATSSMFVGEFAKNPSADGDSTIDSKNRLFLRQPPQLPSPLATWFFGQFWLFLGAESINLLPLRTILVAFVFKLGSCKGNGTVTLGSCISLLTSDLWQDDK